MFVKKRCNKCGACCKGGMGPIIFPNDISDICMKLALRPKMFLGNYCEHDVIKVEDKEISIYYLKLKKGSCIFLREDNLCEIFQCRPYQCRYAPYDFMAKYKFWKHMPCVTQDEFNGLDSSDNDKRILNQLLGDGYINYERRN